MFTARELAVITEAVESILDAYMNIMPIEDAKEYNIILSKIAPFKNRLDQAEEIAKVLNGELFAGKE